MSENPYPSLGFNPVPGSPADVTGLRGQIDSAHEAVRDTNELLGRLRNSNDSVWIGEGGDAFRAAFDATLAQDLGYAQSSLERAVGLCDQWHTGLVGFQDTTNGLETEAAAARGQHAQAVAALQRAQSNPDLGLANRQFSDANQLAAAQSRLNAAVAQVHSASTAVDESQGQIDSIIKRARDLESEHNQLARTIASELDAAAKDFAPSPPDKSIWDRITNAVKGIGKFIADHRKQIHDILGGVAAVSGLLALITPPPADAVFAGVALVAGAGALATDFVDPKVREAFGDIFHGDFSKEAFTKIGTTVGMDALGVIPGVGAASKGVSAFREVGELGPALRSFTEASQAPGIASKILDRIPRPGEATVWLQDVSQVSRHSPGTALAGIELVSRSAKAGLGAFKLESNTWNLITGHD
ncbi:hypothetical protein IU500_19320 [Nocardia terpenica]|uniref:hypothetical protein n=1 Tax=Nocardia terpenica TaxID=455432 RepID=UPI0018960A3F|nr:hypothetical protein [Nocardia terpenica]MBF6062011.1 hypothetical protein [Nocardia terpenica]MBF6106189.1 hypothetical protein [Nocardia terpenica]MBF6110431.1 hypothetical protein [Nocardia terpenica]MBF6120732.1 hypothetical protein [Nocardia terpenica]MBF6151767.1 hypothetical protein [Nocardia terpenica]